MSPRFGPLEIGAPKGKDPRRDDTDPPKVERDPEVTSERDQVASFRTSRFSISLPSAIVLAVVTGFSAALVAWINKPAPTATAVLSPEQSAQLQSCAKLQDDVAEIKTFVVWAQPQIGLLLMRTDSRAYAPPPPRAEVQPLPGFAEALHGKKR